uniref:V-type proton ATPase subunit a n=1 Tax=Timema genevievae TaxID=629358 RepID=A0A7R9JR07_TIMGE|nr:unnamed protein product [Timema genevievae]
MFVPRLWSQSESEAVLGGVWSWEKCTESDLDSRKIEELESKGRKKLIGAQKGLDGTSLHDNELSLMAKSLFELYPVAVRVCRTLTEKFLPACVAPAVHLSRNSQHHLIFSNATFEKLENELREVNQNAEALKRNFLELTELKHILRKTQVFFDEADHGYTSQMNESNREEEQVTLLGEEGLRAGGQALKLGPFFPNHNDKNYSKHEGGVNPTESMTRALISDDSIARQTPTGPVQLGFVVFSFVAGVILRERIPPFERMLWRACRGNVFLRQAEIETPLEDPSNGDQVFKSVFIIFFQGDQLKTRVKKICEGFRATLYPCPEAPADRREMAMGVMTRIEDLNTVMRKIKAIYHTLNLFNLDVTQKCLIAECWVPVLDLETIQLALRRGTERSGSSVPPILNRMESFEDPPTYNRTNKFTNGFQALIYAYGVASYREVNPAPYTIITFPFLFAVMFGDTGHGMIMTLFAAYMVIKEKPLAAKKSDSEIWNIFFGGRYIILLMGLFSMYTGFIYNDVFSKSLNIFGSNWQIKYNMSTVWSNKDLQLNPGTDAYLQYPYPIGLDPVWQVANANKIVFLNAYKMKLSIIIGVFHMLFGVVLSLWNYTYFRLTANIVFQFIPQIIFLIFLFFYMVLLMFINKLSKCCWCAWPCSVSLGCCLVNPSTSCAHVARHIFQKAYFMLKPVEKYLLQLDSNHHPHAGGTENGDAEAALSQAGAQAPAPSGGGHEEPEDITEVFILQGIHTIEYVLGSVSHTASYLRLWALSLAHAQLSEVLWNMVMRNGLIFEDWYGGIALWIIFAFWSVLTVGILVLMEGLSAFLHTLRLHWVEFQSKFYSGLGYHFQPFSFEIILDSAAAAPDE